MSLANLTGAPLDPAAFHTIAKLAYRESGLTLVAQKAPMVQSRLRHRLSDLGLANFNEYAEFLTSQEGLDERRRLISALTTNVSRFFRESHHLDALVAYVRAHLQDLRAGAPLRIWSAGCAQGQEPLSAAIALIEAFPEIAEYDLRILATDIDPQVIAFARAGRYDARMLRGLPKGVRSRQFQADATALGDRQFTVNPKALSLIRYREHNLLGPWPMKMQFDVVFCRNTVIYFDTVTQHLLWPRFHQLIKPQGLLFLGHSERITTPAEFGLHCTGPTTYQPIAPS